MYDKQTYSNKRFIEVEQLMLSIKLIITLEGVDGLKTDPTPLLLLINPLIINCVFIVFEYRTE